MSKAPLGVGLDRCDPQDSLTPALDGRQRRVQFSFEEKLQIVSEALRDGVRQAHVTRKYGLGKNTLARWKQMLGPLCAVDSAAPGDRSSGELERLVSRVAELERLLGQRTLELDVLRQRLQSFRAVGMVADGARLSAPKLASASRLDRS
jgi:transposase